MGTFSISGHFGVCGHFSGSFCFTMLRLILASVLFASLSSAFLFGEDDISGWVTIRKEDSKQFLEKHYYPHAIKNARSKLQLMKAEVKIYGEKNHGDPMDFRYTFN